MLLPETLDNVLEFAAQTTKQGRYFHDPVLWADEVAGVTLWSKQREVSKQIQQNRNVAVKAGHGVGKLVSADTPLPTPTGWVLAGEVQTGDQVLDECGNPTTVVAVSPVWDREKYTITFDDGSQIEAGAEHEWDVLDLSSRTAAMKRGVPEWRDHWDSAKTLESQELYRLGVTTASGQNRWRIPLAQPLQMPEADLPIDPYTLGLWLGDGSSGMGVLTLGKEKIRSLDYVPYGTVPKWVENKNSYTVTVLGLKAGLGDLDLINNKHIPMSYLRSSESQRRALLAGLMDSDGFLMRSNSVGIDMTNKRLAEDIYELLMTLGCKVFWSEGEAAYTLDGERHVTGTRYRMNWTPLENPFRVRGQSWTAPTRQRSRHTQRTIVSIEKTGRVQNYCIEVDSPRHLYLAGRSFIPTHNSYLIAVLTCWWVDTRFPNAFVVSTAPSQAQIGAIVWREVQNLKKRIEHRYNEGLIDHKLPGYITSDNEWKDDSGTIIGFGRRPPEKDVGDMVQGIHAAHVLALGDEAVGLSKEMIEALGNITSNEYSRRVLIANPTRPYCYFADIFNPDEPISKVWSTNTISVLESPHYTDEKHEMPPAALAALTSLQYEEDMRKEHGVESAAYRSRVLGEFDRDSDEPYLIREEDIAVAEDTEFEVREDANEVLGVDVARFGKDVSVIYSNKGGQVRYVDHLDHQSRTTEVANWIHRIASERNVDEVRIDGLGIGGGVVDILLTYPDRKYRIVSLNASGTSPDPRRWYNMRAYWWDSFKSNLQNGRLDLNIEDKQYATLKAELLEVRYKLNPQSGSLIIESKDDMKKRGVKSPDFGDAAVFAGMTDSDYSLENPVKKEISYQDPSEMLELGEYSEDFYLDLMAGGY